MVAFLAVSYVVIPSVAAFGIGPYDSEKSVTALFAVLHDIFPYDRELILAGIPGNCVQDPFDIASEASGQFLAVCHVCSSPSFC